MSGTASATAGIPLTESILNWLWFADLPTWDRALEVTGGPVPLGPAIEAHFGARDAVEITAWIGDPGARLCREGAGYDCVIAHGVFESPPNGRRPWNRAERQRFLAEARGGLKSGGCLALSFTNPIRGLLAPVAGTAPRAGLGWRAPGLGQTWRIRAALRSAGFRHLRRYYLEPSLLRVRYLTPASHSLLVDRAGRRAGSNHTRLAQVLAAMGAADVVFPASLILAYA